MHSNTQIMISDTALNLDTALDFINSSAHGADCVFIGKVRNHNEGRAVIAIDYEIFEPLAQTILQEVSAKILEKNNQELKLFIYHRYGKLVPGDIGMLVAVSAAHRAEAYCANRELVEAIKHRCPVWKKEYYAEGDFQWLKGCALHHES